MKNQDPFVPFLLQVIILSDMPINQLWVEFKNFCLSILNIIPSNLLIITLTPG